MTSLTENAGRLEIASPMPVGRRILFGAAALFPLIAPYELLFKIRWQTWMHPFFFFAALISLGAAAVSALFLLAALGGLQSRMVFDRTRGRLTYSASAPIVPLRSKDAPLASIRAVDVETHDWSDGSPSYSLRVATNDGQTFSTNSSYSRAEIEALRQRVLEFLNPR